MIVVERIPLGDLTDVVTKGTTPTTLKKNFVSDGIPFLRINNLDNGIIDYSNILYIDDDTNRLLKRSVIKSGDFLLTIAGTIGKTAIVPDDAPLMNCNQAIAILRVKERLDKDYLKYWLNTQDAQSQITGAKVTATISNLSLGQIKELNIPLPTLKEQKRIAAILDKADAIRRKRQQAIDLADQLLHSVFLDMFGDVVTNPKEWREESFDDLVSIVGGGTPSRKIMEYWNGDIPWATVKDFTGYELGKALESITNEGLDNSASNLIEAGSIIVPTRMAVGKAAINTIDLAINQDLKAIRIKDSLKINKEFLFRYLLGQSAYLVKRSKGATVKGITLDVLKELVVPVPPLELQISFSEIVARLTLKLARMESSHQSISSLFYSLTQQAFNGELSKQTKAP